MQEMVCLQILAYVSQVRDEIAVVDNTTFTSEQVEANPVRCPDAASAERMYAGDDALMPSQIRPFAVL